MNQTIDKNDFGNILPKKKMATNHQYRYNLYRFKTKGEDIDTKDKEYLRNPRDKYNLRKSYSFKDSDSEYSLSNNNNNNNNNK